MTMNFRFKLDENPRKPLHLLLARLICLNEHLMSRLYPQKILWHLLVWGTCLVLGSGFSTEILAEPIFPSDQCHINELTLLSSFYAETADSDKIYYFIEDDFGTEMDSCVQQVEGGVDGLTQAHAVYVIQMAAEEWNSKSLGPALVYGGEYSESSFLDLVDACSFETEKPALYFRFHKGCLKDESNDCIETTFGVANRIDGCADGASITLFGDGSNTQDSCTGDYIKDWNIMPEEGGFGTGIDLKAALVHEIGHVLGLPHLIHYNFIDPANCDPNATPLDSMYCTDIVTPAYCDLDCGSVMKKTNSAEYRSIWGWDKDCVDDDAYIGGVLRSRKRRVNFYWKGYEDPSTTPDDGFWDTSGAVINVDRHRGFFSGGYLRYDTGSGEAFRFGRYQDSTLAYGLSNTDGTLDFGSSATLNSLLTDLHVAPVLFSPSEFTVSQTNQTNRMSFLTLGETTYPPTLKYLRSNNMFNSGSTGAYERCDTMGCGDADPLESHVPMTSTWDEYSDATVFARVETTEYSNDFGDIFLYTFYDPSTWYNRLAGGEPTIGPFPSDGTADWNFEGVTESAAGIACAPTRSEYPYNCILAWQDTGSPLGAILYQYFRVQDYNQSGYAQHYIEVDSTNGAFRRSGAYSAGGVSAAWFDGRFWLAWKDPSNHGEVKYCYNDGGMSGGSLTAWSSISSAGTEVIDDPTWLYVPQTRRESGLIWTEAE